MTADVAQDVYSHPEFAAFLAAIRAEPADDTPRLVLADWLQEQGEEERAEFIRAQVAAYRGAALHSLKLWELLHGSEWFADLCKVFGFESRHWGVMPDESVEYRHKMSDGWFVVRRGFPEHVTCPAADWLAHGDALLARHPVERVTLTTWPTRDQLADEYRKEDDVPSANRVWVGVTPYMDAYRDIFCRRGGAVVFAPPATPWPA